MASTGINKYVGYAHGVKSLPFYATIDGVSSAFSVGATGTSNISYTQISASSSTSVVLSAFRSVAINQEARTQFLKVSSNDNRPKAVPSGTKWSSAGGAVDTSNGALHLVAGGWQSGVPNSSSETQAGAAGQLLYFDFRMDVPTAGKSVYGWLAGSITFDNSANIGFTVRSYAYDNTGAQIGAGVTSSTPVPEPPSITLLAFAAMATGAAGTRRFKRARTA